MVGPFATIRTCPKSLGLSPCQPQAQRPKPVVLLILDGWGHRDDPRDNALAQADLPNWRALWATRPHTLIHTEGRHVGLPDGQMGNSEVGHMNLGAGRIVYQDLTRIDAAIEDGSFFDNAELLGACARRDRAAAARCMSWACCRPAACTATSATSSRCSTWPQRAGVRAWRVHAFLDGRDTPPQSRRAPAWPRCSASAMRSATRASRRVSGRYFAMDRDQRWDRVQRAWDAIVEATRRPSHAAMRMAALAAAYARGETDEFVAPTVHRRRRRRRCATATPWCS